MMNQPETGDKVLSLLRQYGWEMGLQKLREEIAATPDVRRRNNLLFFAGWMAAERGAYEEAQTLLQDAEESPAAQRWKRFIQAFLAMRQRRFEEAERLLDSVDPEPESILLQAAVAHIRGANAFHMSDQERALRELRESLRLLGGDHYGSGRILDTFGMVYAARDNFHAAEEFYRQAIVRKKAWDDQAGLAVSYGNLGRLHLDWGYLDQAETCFLEDLAIAQNTRDGWGEALMQNGLGRIALERGNRAASAARTSEARAGTGRTRPAGSTRAFAPRQGGGPSTRVMPARTAPCFTWRPTRSKTPRRRLSRPRTSSGPSRSRKVWPMSTELGG